MKLRDIVQFFEQIELLLIASLKRNLKGHREWEKKEGFEWPAWQTEKLQNLERFRRENKKVVERYMPVIDRETENLMREQFEEGKRQVVQEAIAAGVSEKNFFGVNEPRLETCLLYTSRCV